MHEKSMEKGIAASVVTINRLGKLILTIKKRHTIINLAHVINAIKDLKL
jgi:hypothetical protein